jgi:DNA invertase Pin-like site-specific DNA recombinase
MMNTEPPQRSFGRLLPIDVRLKISALSKEGRRQMHIAKEMGVGVRRIRRFQRQSNLPIPTNALPQNLVEKILAMSRAGELQKTIVRELGVHQITVRKYQRLHGLPTQRPELGVPEKVEAKIVRQLKQQRPQRKIAKEFRTTMYIVRKLASKHGIKSDWHITPDLRDKILHDKSSGRLCAKKFDVSVGTVYAIRRLHREEEA